MTPVAPKPKLWPRMAVSPEGNRARFACMGDVPHGWTLEVPLPDTPLPGEPVIEVESADDPDDLADARAEYRAVVGKKAGPKWDVATIRAKIAEEL